MNNLEAAAIRSVVKKKATADIGKEMIQNISTTGVWNDQQSWELDNEFKEYAPSENEGPKDTCATRLLASSKVARQIAIKALIHSGIAPKDAEYKIEDMIRLKEPVPKLVAKALVEELPESFTMWSRPEKIQSVGVVLQVVGLALIGWTLLK